MSTKTKAARERRKKRKRQENRKLRNKAERVERAILAMGRPSNTMTTPWVKLETVISPT
jgi:hypothetical protein